MTGHAHSDSYIDKQRTRGRLFLVSPICAELSSHDIYVGKCPASKLIEVDGYKFEHQDGTKQTEVDYEGQSPLWSRRVSAFLNECDRPDVFSGILGIEDRLATILRFQYRTSTRLPRHSWTSSWLTNSKRERQRGRYSISSGYPFVGVQ